uniref:Lectin_legB domain-containing protein n=1 Tax=Panagrellus redivivus TaxID=6233 RepID=A0A7E4V9C3_PANRE
MSVCNILVTVAAVVLGINGAPTNTGYFLANDLSTISNEVGLTASTTTNGISFAIGETASSKQFAVAVDESRFVIGLYVPEQRYNSHLAVTVTNPKTGVFIETKVMLRVDSDGLGHVTLASTGKYLGGFENYFIQIVVTSDGYMGLGPVVDSTRTIRFAAYNYMLYYDATHKFFMLTLSAQSLPAILKSASILTSSSSPASRHPRALRTSRRIQDRPNVEINSLTLTPRLPLLRPQTPPFGSPNGGLSSSASLLEVEEHRATRTYRR